MQLLKRVIFHAVIISVIIGGCLPGLAQENKAGPVPALASSLTFKVMLSVYSNGGLTRVTSALLTVRTEGSIYAQASPDGNGFLEFTIPTATPSTWSLEVGSLATRNFSAEVVDGFLQLRDVDSDNLEIWYFENPSGDGSYAFEYYKDTLYVCNRAEPGAPILSRISTIRVLEMVARGWRIGALDNQGDVGQFTSLALDHNDKPHISYYDATNTALKYFDGATGQALIVDNDGDVGEHTSLALDRAGYPHISYYDGTGKNLKYYDGANDRSLKLDSFGDVGKYTSLALDRAGNPHISYYDGTFKNLKYYNGADRSKSTLDRLLNVGLFTSLALDRAGKPHISYFMATLGNLKYYNGATGQKGTLDNIGFVGIHTSIALDPFGNPHISYGKFLTGDLKYYNGAIGRISILDRNFLGAFFSSIALDSKGNPHISYSNLLGRQLLYFNGIDGTVTVVDSTQVKHTSLALDSQDRAHISYYDVDKKDLRYAIGPLPAAATGGTPNHFGGGGRLGSGPTPGQTSGSFNAARVLGRLFSFFRALPFSYGSDNPGGNFLVALASGKPGVTIQWTYTDGSSQAWAVALDGSAVFGQGSTVTTQSLLNNGVPYISIELDLSAAFLADLEPGTHTLTYWLWDQEGNKSNARWEYIEIEDE